MSKVLSVKFWFWINILLHGIFGGIVNSLWSADVAEDLWGAGNVQSHDEIYERFIGYMVLALVIILIGIVVITKGRELNRLALVVSGAFVFLFSGLAFYGSANDYGEDGVTMWLAPIIPTLLLGASAIRALRQSIE